MEDSCFKMQEVPLWPQQEALVPWPALQPPHMLPSGPLKSGLLQHLDPSRVAPRSSWEISLMICFLTRMELPERDTHELLI